MKAIRVKLGERSYPIIVSSSYQKLPWALKRLGLPHYAVVVSHRRLISHCVKPVLGALQRAGWQADILTIPPSETSKSFAVTQRLIAEVAKKAMMQVPLLIAVGGGVVGDVTGFVAATFRRGVPYIQLPTTLLSQVDSAIGGKVGIDVAQAKNLVGAFYQPRLVWNNTSVLKSLPLRQRRSGLSEIIKYGVIADPVLFRLLEKQLPDCLGLHGPAITTLITRSCRIKARVVSQDEREKLNIRSQLNFGHTLGHALEAAGNYTLFTHGEAIAVGMCAAADLAAEAGFCDKKLSERIRAVIVKAGLPTIARGVSIRRVLAALRFDKKFTRGRQRWVVPRRLGKVMVTEAISPRLVERVIKRYVKAR